MANIPFLEWASRTVAPDGNVLTDDLALFPFVIIGEYFGNTNILRALLGSFRRMSWRRLLVLRTDEVDMVHVNK
jgi:hypothetical protein